MQLRNDGGTDQIIGDRVPAMAAATIAPALTTVALLRRRKKDLDKEQA
jgi:hypothetical protein